MTAASTPDPLAETPGILEDRPRPWLLPTHMLAGILVQSTWHAITFMLPYIALQRFGANPWEVMIITAAPNVLIAFSIFWQHVSRRIRPATYLIIFWAVAYLPWGLAGAATSYWHLAVLHLIASFGFAAWSPISGDLLNRFYSPAARGRAFGWMSAGVLLFAIAGGLGAGELLNRDPEAFRYLLPAGAASQLAGVLLLAWLDHVMKHTRQAAPVSSGNSSEGLWAVAVEPIVRMRSILKADRLFLRYEAAYMTYGVGWMICYALLPLIGKEKLKLPYDVYPLATQAPLMGMMLLLALPFGWLNDRMGPARMSTLAFGFYILFPLGLIFSQSALQLGGACVVWGVCAAAVNVGWMLGPVALAPSSDKVQHYVAIHATMVGLRGTLFQFLGIALFELTGLFTIPLVLAAAGFAWAAWQMWSLEPEFAARTGRGVGGATTTR